MPLKILAKKPQILLQFSLPIYKDFKALDPKDRLNIAVKISNFMLPRLQSVEIDNYPEWTELIMLTSEDRANEIMRLKEEIENEEN